jgi:hypothetical protein
LSREQRLRAILFYLSVSIFFIGLPFILSFALGYKFNTKTFKFTKTGLIAVKTQPQGASIYLEGKLLNDKTPATINELLPGKYRLRIELDNYYAWFGEVNMEAGKVKRLEKIILFPLRPNVVQLNKEKITSFWIDQEKERIYYISLDENIIYKSDLNGGNFEEIGALPDNLAVKRWKVSPDKEKLLCFNTHQLAVINLESQSYLSDSDSTVISENPNRKIIDVFWHSDSYHLILITDRNIEVLEASPDATAVNLVNLNKKNIPALYDANQDTLYFIDSQKAADGEIYDNVYKLELGTKFSPFHGLIKPKLNESN